MEDCIFCKIVKGQIPSQQVYEDDKFLVFLDIRPLAEGNVLVIPKDHYRWVIDVPEFGEYWQVAKKVAQAVQKAVSAESISFLTLGYEIPHAHIRVIPRFQNDPHRNGIDLKAIREISQDDMQKIRQNIINNLQKL